jgi:hypothetical protein
MLTGMNRSFPMSTRLPPRPSRQTADLYSAPRIA